LRLFNLMFQATLTYAQELEEIVEQGGAVAGALPDTAEEMAEGVAFFRAIAPLVAEVGSSEPWLAASTAGPSCK
jgi:hypothetical protein